MNLEPASHPKDFRAFPRSVVDGSIGDRFQEQVQQHGGELAIGTDDTQVSYRDLDRFANTVAHAVVARLPSGRPSRVLVLTGGGVNNLAAILGVLKSGHAFVVLDPFFPEDRNRMVAEQSEAALILADSETVALARRLVGGTERIYVLEEAHSRFGASDPGVVVVPDALACLIFTSGSTGRPKGVMHTHRSLLHGCMRRTNLQRVAPSDRMTLLYSSSVMGSVYCIFGALLNGASVFPYDIRERGITAIADWLSTHRITIYHSVSSVFRQLAGEASGGLGEHAVRLAILGGERVLWSDIERGRMLFGSGVEFFTGLGASETGTVCHLPITAGTHRRDLVVPIGRSVEGMEVLLLDQEGVPVAEGEVGEITVRSRYLASGYWKNPEASTRVFKQDKADPRLTLYRTGDLGRLRSDGELAYFGRRDFQVKIRGFRVETAEVEATLLAHPSITDAVLVARPVNGEDILVVYYVSSSPQPPRLSELRAFLRRTLPNHMLPSEAVRMKELPRTPNNKVDRQALPEFVPETETSIEPVGERLLSQADDEFRALCSETLGRELPNLAENFFDLGGNSVTAYRLISGIQRDYGVNLSMRTLLLAEDLRAIMSAIAGAAEATLHPSTFSDR